MLMGRGWGLPICRRGHETNPLLRNILRHKRTNRMTDKYICQLNTLPKSPPRLSLRCIWRCNQITPDMDMTAEDHRAIRSHIFGDGDQRCHLRVVDDDDMGASFGRWLERSFTGEPVAFCVLVDPIGDLLIVLSG